MVGWDPRQKRYRGGEKQTEAKSVVRRQKKLTEGSTANTKTNKEENPRGRKQKSNCVRWEWATGEADHFQSKSTREPVKKPTRKMKKKLKKLSPHSAWKGDVRGAWDGDMEKSRNNRRVKEEKQKPK